MYTVYHTHSPEETMNLGKQLASRLQPGSVVLLFGDLGSGKTHFTKGIAQGLGIFGVIKSPTFTYVNMFQVPRSRFQDLALGTWNVALYHYDLYRLTPGESFHSIGLEDTIHDPKAINVIEWADRLVDDLPRDYIRVDLKSDADIHEIQIEFVDSEITPEALVEHFWQEWTTPMHVRAHCKQVAKVALKIGQAFADKNVLIDLNLLNTASLLHDMARVCDFNHLNRNKFHEEVTDEKWNKWLELRRRFEGQNHADIAAAALTKLGYVMTSELIRSHHSLTIVKEPECLEQLETAILYYADKRVKHDEIVPLAERFRDGRERYGYHDDEAQKELYLQVEEKTFELEEKIFKQIDLRPEDIV